MKRGFTLAEMLIALALTALAIAIISEGVRRSLDFQERLETVRTERETQRAALDAVRGRLEQLVPVEVPAENPDEQAEILFAGNANSVVFLAADPGYPSRAGLYEYRLQVIGGDEEVGDMPALIVSRRGLTDLDQFNRAEADRQSWALPLSAALQFGYAGEGGNFQSSWTTTDAFPTAISLQADGEAFPAMTALLPRPAPEAENPASPQPADNGDTQ